MALSIPNQVANLKSKIKIAAMQVWIESVKNMPPPQTPQELDQMMSAFSKVNKMVDKECLGVNDEEGKKSVADLQKELEGVEVK